MRETGTFLARLLGDESGISSVEYAMLLALVAAGIIVSVELLGDAVAGELADAASCISQATTAGGGSC